jgi:hypothetical protein
MCVIAATAAGECQESLAIKLKMLNLRHTESFRGLELLAANGSACTQCLLAERSCALELIFSLSQELS